MKELLSHGGVVAIARDGHHVAAVIAQVLDGTSAGDVPLVRHEAEKDQYKDSDNHADGNARKAPAGVQVRQEREEAHRR